MWDLIQGQFPRKLFYKTITEVVSITSRWSKLISRQNLEHSEVIRLRTLFESLTLNRKKKKKKDPKLTFPSVSVSLPITFLRIPRGPGRRYEVSLLAAVPAPAR